MRVLFWSDWFLPSVGGVEVFAGHLLPALVRRGHELEVVAGHHRDGLPRRADFEGVAIHRLALHQALAAGDPVRVAEQRREVARIARDLRPDVVHLNTLGPSAFFVTVGTRAPAPLLLTVHSPIPAEAERLDTLVGAALRSAVWVNCNSRAVHGDLCRRIPELRRRSSVTYYGVEVPALAPAPRPRVDPVVLAFGRLVPDKGFDVAVRAFAHVVRAVPRARLVVAGDGPARAELERLVADAGLAGVATIADGVAPAKVPALINTASVVVVPSRWDEPFGLVAVEAALMKRPVVASRVGGLVEAVEDGVTGVVVPKEDPAALADAVIGLLADPAAADRLGSAGRERARRLFAWNRCVDEYERLYELVRQGKLGEEDHA